MVFFLLSLHFPSLATAGSSFPVFGKLRSGIHSYVKVIPSEPYECPHVAHSLGLNLLKPAKRKGYPPKTIGVSKNLGNVKECTFLFAKNPGYVKGGALEFMNISLKPGNVKGWAPFGLKPGKR